MDGPPENNTSIDAASRAILTCIKAKIKIADSLGLFDAEAKKQIEDYSRKSTLGKYLVSGHLLFDSFLNEYPTAMDDMAKERQDGPDKLARMKEQTEKIQKMSANLENSVKRDAELRAQIEALKQEKRDNQASIEQGHLQFSATRDAKLQAQVETWKQEMRDNQASIDQQLKQGKADMQRMKDEQEVVSWCVGFHRTFEDMKRRRSAETAGLETSPLTEKAALEQQLGPPKEQAKENHRLELAKQQGLDDHDRDDDGSKAGDVAVQGEDRRIPTNTVGKSVPTANFLPLLPLETKPAAYHAQEILGHSAVGSNEKLLDGLASRVADLVIARMGGVKTDLVEKIDSLPKKDQVDRLESALQEHMEYTKNVADETRKRTDDVFAGVQAIQARMKEKEAEDAELSSGMAEDIIWTRKQLQENIDDSQKLLAKIQDAQRGSASPFKITSMDRQTLSKYQNALQGGVESVIMRSGYIQDPKITAAIWRQEYGPGNWLGEHNPLAEIEDEMDVDRRLSRDGKAALEDVEAMVTQLEQA